MYEQPPSKSWIRGVNIGGWLLLERWITPYLFAITSCHIEGEFCWYPGQLSAPPSVLAGSSDQRYCDLFTCQPQLIDSATGERDFPTDEYTLSKIFPDKSIAEKYLENHFKNFVTKNDVKQLKETGVTHVRVPIPHWIMGDVREDEPWIVEGRWLYFIRFVGWCRQYGIDVWIDVHTAPGSQNGFDNSGILLESFTCVNWSTSKENVERSIKAVKDIAQAIVDDSLDDVVTGFGVLNEPFADCDREVVKDFNNEALDSVRSIMGDETNVFIGDMFNATNWNDGWWSDEFHANTYLDSHYYHVFGERTRALSPKQHIAYLCARNARDTTSCCYEDQPLNQKVSPGISRIIGEWSAAYDTLPVEKLKDVMKSIKDTGEALDLNRSIPANRRAFLKKFVQAQMVTYESEQSGASSGWFYWTLKTEGGAFAEWNFLLGASEGWIPPFPSSDDSSESVYGTCESIASSTQDDMSIINEFPDPNHLSDKLWLGEVIDDDYVISHAGNKVGTHSVPANTASANTATTSVATSAIGDDDGFETLDDDLSDDKVPPKKSHSWFPLFVLAFFCYGIYRVFLSPEQFRFRRSQYTSLDPGFGNPTSLRV